MPTFIVLIATFWAGIFFAVVFLMPNTSRRDEVHRKLREGVVKAIATLTTGAGMGFANEQDVADALQAILDEEGKNDE